MPKVCIIIAVFLLFLPLAAQSAEVRSKGEEEKRDATIAAKSGSFLMGQKNFLHRVIDDLDKSIHYMEEDIENLESRIGSITLLEPERRNKDLASIKSVYESHLKWLYKMKEAFKLDYDSYFADATAGKGWIKRCAIMVETYEKFRIKAKRTLANYEKKKERLIYFLNRQRFLMTETESLRNEIAAIEKRKGVIPPHENNLKSLKSKLWAYQVEMNAIALYKEEMYLHYLLLIEQLRDKRDWLSMKIEAYKVLSNLAPELVSAGGDDFRRRYGEVIETYEKGIAFLKGRADMTGKKDWSITPYGDIREVERFEELTGYYKGMKSRYDDYKRFLGAQADGFRADMEMKGWRH
ncbi:MAG: hypothetical protein OEV42_05730 [Deltaproteobacteria bacterium]|nr:hypothetical protein [Deltaproteobacteria bacterium]